MYNAVGGSTIIYAAHWQRFIPSDFCVKTLDGIAEDWPFTYEELEPFYDQMEIDMGVSGLAGDPAYPPQMAPPLPPMPINKIGRKAAEGMNKLGWHWWPSPNSVPSRPYGGRNACVRRGTCLTGCPERAKASMDLTHWPEAIAAGAKLVTGARVSKIETDAKGMATGAVYIDRSGRERRQRASTVIVCANAVGTARLLLLSASGKFANGLANSSCLVGTHLMMHPYAAVNGLFDEPLESWLGPSGQAIHSLEFVESDSSRGFLRGGKWQVMPTGGPLGMRAGYGGKAIEDAWGANLHKSTKRNFGRSFEWGITAEDLPEASNRVTLASDMTDSDGIPSPKIIYRNSDNTRMLLDFHVARAREAMQASGAIEISSTSLMRDCGWHLMGTARMGNNPETSVVDQWCRSHDIPNLYVVDGSVFVTSSASNPTATITAVALRAVKHMIANRRNQETAA
jgi:choline dehydrogenase-like flavoprotein